MTFKEAKAALKELAEDKYYALKFQSATYTDGTERITITAYIDGIGHTPDFPNYELALTSMQAMILQKDNPQLIDEMIPE